MRKTITIAQLRLSIRSPILGSIKSVCEIRAEVGYGRNTYRLGIPEGLPSRRPGVPPPLFILYCLRVRVGFCAPVTGEADTVVAKKKNTRSRNGKRMCLNMSTLFTAQQRRDEKQIISRGIQRIIEHAFIPLFADSRANAKKYNGGIVA